MSKFTTRLLRRSQKVHREDDRAVHNDHGIDECKKERFDNTEYWSVEMKKDCVNAPQWPLEDWISVLAKSGGQKKRFQYCLNSNSSNQFLYFRAIQGHSGSTINPALQDNVLLPEGLTEYIYLVGNGKELRSMMNHGLIPGGRSLRTGRQAVFFTVVNPMDKQESRHTKIFGKAYRIQYFGVIYCSLNKEDCTFCKQSQTQLSSMTHCLQSSLRKRYA